MAFSSVWRRRTYDSAAPTTLLINLENLDRLFEPFFSTKPKGMGMGLAISRSIIESHGGRLWTVPNDGPGVTFKFALPVDAEGPTT